MDGVNRDCVLLSETPVIFIRSSSQPFALQLHVTEQCNLRCSHCYSESWTDDLSFDRFQSIISQFKDILRIGKVEGTVYLTGGEPLLWPHLIRAIQHLIRERLVPRVLTNGTLITKDIAHELQKSKVRYVQVSLDGMKSVHDSIRGPGSFESATSGIELLVSAGIEVTVMLTLMKRNLRDLESLIELAESLGVKRVAFGRFIPLGNGCQIDSENLSASEVNDAFERLERMSKNCLVEIVKRDPLWEIVEPSKNDFAGCSAGQLILDVLTDGTVYPCRRLPIEAGNVFDSSLLDIWISSPIMNRLRNRSNLACNQCEKVLICGGCRGVAFGESGDAFSKDPHCFLS
ncbi:MAG: radical SAM protein [Candidatus Thorarchaeota archaeon]